ncbi:peptidyl-prolyl cis-trans isomerase FKBP8-like [Colletes gigas]|uniref:peptidyl-prolyl cis-trans isomerase FKBP8-like n=1 Tax=Colletes gigas TaxID=935657 RepID=UPI001C9B19D0|nr:peptidyl-prolyl cis-trans isomerase FKBP8-like [Colletes gigas]XP_043261870.1 peptidyl-prolyl cis-trans isomerase FKBP8-like [Colletes gigas]XP_043261871.1 peptidyl-prolyl cis-trans isomerase FKBP8-like [Colletes gigas]XP_043261872.1 peptidyl-prolyl cis-trans isomerase FKBP8-like [Colletes gigas]XP_043261873.1 peptidyl-prolyl cis-trans isomerase FKBP8-like [Colletes gigas]XP_043261874.1 peptidyl-prolyl cis-trans isomerase FKBP8-like [Colletes gigas]XP_043261875.1 peptidyl-prolyl cis-trans 
MEDEPVQPGVTQADFIKKELNFDANVEDPMTQATLNNRPTEDGIDILGHGQLKKKVVKPGKPGTRPNRSDICTLKIIGKLKDGTVVEEYEDHKIQLGDVEVIQGLDLAIALMDVDEIAEIEVDPRFAYGHSGKPPSIPPDAVLTYTVELKSVELEEEIDSLSINQRKEIGNSKRERGNWWFTRNEPTLAIQCYRRALEFLVPMESRTSYQNEVEDSTTDAELQALLEDRMKLYNNLAAAQIKTQAYDAALKSVECVLSCQPQNVKALFRKGKLLHYKGEHALAYQVLLQAAKLKPETKAIQTELAILRKKNAKDAEHEKNLYRKMLGTCKTKKKENKGAIKSYVELNSKLTWSLIGGATAAVVGVLLYRVIS